MIKPTKRKAFNFLRSYFDVLNELKTDSDKLKFLTAIIDKQFLNKDPEKLNFVVNLCYESQRHQIESSVKGWERASKNTLSTTPPTTPLTTPPTPWQEEEEEEEEKGEYTPKGESVLTEDEEATPINYINLLAFFNTKRSEKLPKSKGISVISDNVKSQYKKRIKEGYDKQQIAWSIENAFNDKFFADNNYKHLTIGYFSRANTLDLYGTEPTQTKKDKEVWDW